MTTIEILKKARELLSNPASWTHAEVLQRFDEAIARLEAAG